MVLAVTLSWAIHGSPCPAQPLPAALNEQADPRPPLDDAELRYWLSNMLGDHRFTAEEAAAATGMSPAEVDTAAERLGVTREPAPKTAGGNVKVLPYPGGRHPRIGFLDGALRPQRETKVSVFAPWDDRSYVVIDVPEAIWCQHGLLYLAHSHIDTMWTKQKIELEKLEWRRLKDGKLEIERRLPNGVTFGARVTPQPDGVAMECQLQNGSDETLSDLRVQMCAMLKGLDGFAAQTNDNKLFRGDYACCRSPDGKRWVIMAWTPNQRTWGNAPCPCLHSDPQFPDCPPGETVTARGRLWFYEGEAIEMKLRELEASQWRE
ncbi:MAG: hypothetical protein SGJ19_07730 [Planctomycetia bacterium]|nr:hypothetical protein [Planctomycetia bacterium]